MTPNTGETAAAYEKDLLALINTFVTNNLSLDGAYFLMSETRAAQIALLRDALGNSYFNGMALRGSRTLLGIPVITSQARQQNHPCENKRDLTCTRWWCGCFLQRPSDIS